MGGGGGKLRYSNEKDGQIAFLNDYLPLVDRTLSLDEVLSDNTDGVINGNLLEFKLNISDLNAVLFQSIKYLSAMRIKGKNIPANIILISLDINTAYIYNSADYLKDIEKIYIGSASKNNAGFIGKNYTQKLEFKGSDKDEATLIELLRSKKFTKINIDENCIVGWASRYYRENPKASKASFLGDKSGKVNIIGEIRSPQLFKNFINAYKGETNAKFEYLMDKLNDNIKKKSLGAFYTPNLYVEKAYELLRKAIKRVPKGNNYVIIDRCAGTGNLEKLLPDDILKHCILSTVEYYEYKVLHELLSDKVICIIPPTEKDDTFNDGLVRGADALAESYINNEVIKKYINNPKCTIILFENPPYAETTSIEHQKAKKSKAESVWKKSFVVQEMKKDVKGSVLNDLGNAFIYSAFKYYLRQKTDSYIVFSPVKYWKAQHLIDKEFLGGFAFNRKHFHTNINACIMCALWGQKASKITEFELEAFDIVRDGKDEKLKSDGKVAVKRIYSKYSSVYYDKREFKADKTNGILLNPQGLECDDSVKKRITPLFNPNIIGYLVADGSGFNNPDAVSSLLVAGRYNGNGFYLRKDNFLEKLPMFAASRYIRYCQHYTKRALIMKSADGAKRYFKDIESGKLEQTLLKVLLFTSLEMQNHCRSFSGSDGRAYKNELCLDGQTSANKALKDLKKGKKETKLLELWQNLLSLAKKTKNYDKTLTYGIYQISVELNTNYKDDLTQSIIYDYPELNGALNTLKEYVKHYYISEIVPFLFEYELLK